MLAIDPTLEGAPFVETTEEVIAKAMEVILPRKPDVNHQDRKSVAIHNAEFLNTMPKKKSDDDEGPSVEPYHAETRELLFERALNEMLFLGFTPSRTLPQTGSESQSQSQKSESEDSSEPVKETKSGDEDESDRSKTTGTESIPPQLTTQLFNALLTVSLPDRFAAEHVVKGDLDNLEFQRTHISNEMLLTQPVSTIDTDIGNSEVDKVEEQATSKVKEQATSSEETSSEGTDTSAAPHSWSNLAPTMSTDMLVAKAMILKQLLEEQRWLQKDEETDDQEGTEARHGSSALSLTKDEVTETLQSMLNKYIFHVRDALEIPPEDSDPLRPKASPNDPLPSLFSFVESSSPLGESADPSSAKSSWFSSAFACAYPYISMPAYNDDPLSNKKQMDEDMEAAHQKMASCMAPSAFVTRSVDTKFAAEAVVGGSYMKHQGTLETSDETDPIYHDDDSTTAPTSPIPNYEFAGIPVNGSTTYSSPEQFEREEDGVLMTNTKPNEEVLLDEVDALLEDAVCGISVSEDTHTEPQDAQASPAVPNPAASNQATAAAELVDAEPSRVMYFKESLAYWPTEEVSAVVSLRDDYVDSDIWDDYDVFQDVAACSRESIASELCEDFTEPMPTNGVAKGTTQVPLSSYGLIAVDKESRKAAIKSSPQDILGARQESQEASVDSNPRKNIVAVEDQKNVGPFFTQMPLPSSKRIADNNEEIEDRPGPCRKRAPFPNEESQREISKFMPSTSSMLESESPNERLTAAGQESQEAMPSNRVSDKSVALGNETSQKVKVYPMPSEECVAVPNDTSREAGEESVASTEYDTASEHSQGLTSEHAASSGVEMDEIHQQAEFEHMRPNASDTISNEENEETTTGASSNNCGEGCLPSTTEPAPLIGSVTEDDDEGGSSAGGQETDGPVIDSVASSESVEVAIRERLGANGGPFFFRVPSLEGLTLSNEGTWTNGEASDARLTPEGTSGNSCNIIERRQRLVMKTANISESFSREQVDTEHKSSPRQSTETEAVDATEGRAEEEARTRLMVLSLPAEATNDEAAAEAAARYTDADATTTSPETASPLNEELPLFRAISGDPASSDETQLGPVIPVGFTVVNEGIQPPAMSAMGAVSTMMTETTRGVVMSATGTQYTFYQPPRTPSTPSRPTLTEWREASHQAIISPTGSAVDDVRSAGSILDSAQDVMNRTVESIETMENSIMMTTDAIFETATGLSVWSGGPSTEKRQPSVDEDDASSIVLRDADERVWGYKKTVFTESIMKASKQIDKFIKCNPCHSYVMQQAEYEVKNNGLWTEAKIRKAEKELYARLDEHL